MSTITPAATIPVTGSFATNPSYSGTFIPAIWSGKLNVKFYATTVFGEIANTNYEGDIKNLGDKVVINNIPSIAIRDYTVGSTLTYDVPTPSTVELQINYAKYFGVNVSDVLAYQSQPQLMSMFTDDAANQLKIAIDAETLAGTFGNGASANKGATAGVKSASFNLGTDTSPLTLTTSNAVSTLTALSAVLDEQNVPETDRFLLISPVDRQILMNSALSQAYLTGDETSILRNGKIGTIDRFTVYVSNQLPSALATYAWPAPGAMTPASGSAPGTAKRRAMIAGHKSAITFASQISKVEDLANPNDFGRLVRGLSVYGFKVIKPEALALAVIA